MTGQKLETAPRSSNGDAILQGESEKYVILIDAGSL